MKIESCGSNLSRVTLEMVKFNRRINWVNFGFGYVLFALSRIRFIVNRLIYKIIIFRHIVVE